MAGSPPPPSETVRCWNEQSGPRWVALQNRIDAQLAPLGAAAIAALAPQRGERIVDVGCGCGHTLLELAGLVGDTGKVLGVDISEPMLACAREHASRHALQQIEVVCADAELYPFERMSFDAVFSRFGVMFFNNPDAAFKNLRRALKKGGRLSFVCWQSLEENAWARVPLDAVFELLRAADPEQPPELPAMYRPSAPGPFSLADPEQVSALLTRAGFSNICVEAKRASLSFGGSENVQQAVEFAMEIGPASHLTRDTDPAFRPQIAEALRQALVPYVKDGGVWLESGSFLVSARA